MDIKTFILNSLGCDEGDNHDLVMLLFQVQLDMLFLHEITDSFNTRLYELTIANQIQTTCYYQDRVGRFRAYLYTHKHRNN